MAKVGEIIRRKQPEVYRQLMLIYPAPPREEDETNFREIEAIMRHDGYVRGRGGSVRQVRRG